MALALGLAFSIGLWATGSGRAWAAGASGATIARLPTALDRYALVPAIPPIATTLTDQGGRRTQLSRFKGQVLAMYFGYTYCPDVCPTTLSRLAAMRSSLGALKAHLRVVFVSVDPQRDTPPRLRAYLANFDPSFVGLTGTQEQVAALANHYGVRYAAEKPEAGNAYTVAHTSYVYLLDRQGTVRYLFPDDVPLDVLIRGVQALLHS